MWVSSEHTGALMVPIYYLRLPYPQRPLLKVEGCDQASCFVSASSSITHSDPGLFIWVAKQSLAGVPCFKYHLAGYAQSFSHLVRHLSLTTARGNIPFSSFFTSLLMHLPHCLSRRTTVTGWWAFLPLPNCWKWPIQQFCEVMYLSIHLKATDGIQEVIVEHICISAFPEPEEFNEPLSS